MAEGRTTESTSTTSGPPATDQVSVVITLDASNASPARALESIINAGPEVRDIHFELCGEADQKVVLGHPNVANLITKFGADAVFWHPGFLDVQTLQTQALVRVQPDHVFLASAFYALKKDLKRHPGCSHFALLSGLNLRATPVSWWYGFLVPLLVVDTLASWLTLNQHQRTVDIRAQLIYRTWPGKNRPPSRPSWWRWWIGTRICWTRAGTSFSSQAPSTRDAGLAFVLRTIKQHAHLSPWKVWWIALYAAHYLFVLTMCALLFTASLGGDGLWTDGRFSGTVLAFVCAFVAYSIWSRAVQFPNYSEGLALLLYPVYLLLSPLVLVYGRWHTSQSTLDVALEQGKEE